MTQSAQESSRPQMVLRRRIGTTTKVVMQLRGINVSELTRRSSWNDVSKTSRLLNGHAHWRDTELVEVAGLLGIDVGMLFEEPAVALEHLGLSREVAEEMVANIGLGGDTPDEGQVTSRYHQYASVAA